MSGLRHGSEGRNLEYRNLLQFLSEIGTTQIYPNFGLGLKNSHLSLFFSFSALRAFSMSTIIIEIAIYNGRRWVTFPESETHQLSFVDSQHLNMHHFLSKQF